MFVKTSEQGYKIYRNCIEYVFGIVYLEKTWKDMYIKEIFIFWSIFLRWPKNSNYVNMYFWAYSKNNTFQTLRIMKKLASQN